MVASRAEKLVVERAGQKVDEKVASMAALLAGLKDDRKDACWVALMADLWDLMWESYLVAT